MANLPLAVPFFMAAPRRPLHILFAIRFNGVIYRLGMGGADPGSAVAYTNADAQHHNVQGVTAGAFFNGELLTIAHEGLVHRNIGPTQPRNVTWTNRSFSGATVIGDHLVLMTSSGNIYRTGTDLADPVLVGDVGNNLRGIAYHDNNLYTAEARGGGNLIRINLASTDPPTLARTPATTIGRLPSALYPEAMTSHDDDLVCADRTGDQMWSINTMTPSASRALGSFASGVTDVQSMASVGPLSIDSVYAVFSSQFGEYRSWHNGAFHARTEAGVAFTHGLQNMTLDAVELNGYVYAGAGDGNLYYATTGSVLDRAPSFTRAAALSTLSRGNRYHLFKWKGNLYADIAETLYTINIGASGAPTGRTAVSPPYSDHIHNLQHVSAYSGDPQRLALIDRDPVHGLELRTFNETTTPFGTSGGGTVVQGISTLLDEGLADHPAGLYMGATRGLLFAPAPFRTFTRFTVTQLEFHSLAGAIQQSVGNASGLLRI